MSLGWNHSFRRLTSGIGSQGVSLVLLTAVNLLSVPVLLRAWGAEEYGRWMMALSGAALLGLLDGGLHGYFTNRIRHFWSRDEMDSACRSFRTGLALYAVPMLVAVSLAAGVTALGLLPAAFPWLAAAAILVLPRGLVSGVLSAGGRFGLEVWLVLPSVVGAPLAVMAAAGLFGLGPDGAAVIHACVSLPLAWGPLLLVVRRLHPNLGWRPVLPGRHELRQLLCHAPLFFLPQASNLLLLNVPVVMLGRMAGAEAVALFTMLRTFTGLTRQLVQQCAIPVGIELANQHSRGDRRQLDQVFRVSTGVLVAIAGMGCGCALVVGPDFFSLWSAGRVAFAPVPAGFFLAAVLLSAPMAGGLSLLRHWHDPVPQARGIVAHTVGGVLACTVLIPGFGVNGAVLALAAAEVLAAVFLLWPAAVRLMALEQGGARLWAALAGAVGFAAWAGATAGASLWLMPVHTMADLMVALALWGVAQLPAAWVGWRLAA